MGLWLLLASLSMLFGAALVGYLVIRFRTPEWPPPESPGLPAGVWVSTALLLVISCLLVVADRASRRARPDTLFRALVVAGLSALAFLVSQTGSWVRLASDGVLASQNLQVWGFYTLSFLHAAHVLGGLAALALVSLRARSGHYADGASDGVNLVGIYWHFLLVTWFAILIVLLV